MQQLKTTMSGNSLVFALIAIPAVVFASCKMNTLEPTSQRTQLGTMQVAVVSSLPASPGIEFRGRVTGFDKIDTVFVVPGAGSFKHFVSLSDTLTGDTVRIYYTLPIDLRFKVDTTLRTVLVYKEADTRFALILKGKNDSLVSMIGTMHPDELDTVQTKTGDQEFRVKVGRDVHVSRNTDCGREGDFNMLFLTNQKFATVPPARTGTIQNAEKVYSVVNVVNTQPIKDFNTCPDFRGAFSYMIVLQ